MGRCLQVTFTLGHSPRLNWRALWDLPQLLSLLLLFFSTPPPTPRLLRYNGHITLYKCQVYGVRIWCNSSVWIGGLSFLLFFLYPIWIDSLITEHLERQASKWKVKQVVVKAAENWGEEAPHRGSSSYWSSPCPHVDCVSSAVQSSSFSREAGHLNSAVKSPNFKCDQSIQKPFINTARAKQNNCELDLACSLPVCPLCSPETPQSPSVFPDTLHLHDSSFACPAQPHSLHWSKS